jgi:long-chain fatty acid transport protein
MATGEFESVVLTRPVACLLAAAAFVLLRPATANAAGFAAAEFAGESGTVVSPKPAALFFNPAGIAYVDGFAISAGGVLALRGGTWSHARSKSDVADPSDAEGANVGTAHFMNVFGSPFLGVTKKLDYLSFGIATYAPFGGRIHWSPNHVFVNDQKYPLAGDGIQRWSIIEGGITHLYSTVGVAIRGGPVAFGITGNLIYSNVFNTQAKSLAGQGAPDTANEGRNSIDVSGIEGSLGAGLMVEAVEDQLWFGASYQSRPGLGGPMKLAGTMTLSYQGDVTSTPITFTHALPDILRLGIRYRPLPAFELRVFGDYTRWSAMQAQCISMRDKPCAVTASGADATPDQTTIQYLARNWKDTVGLRMGLTYLLAPGVEVHAGAGYETAAVPNETLDPMMTDSRNLRMALGGRVAISPAMAVTLGITGVYYLPRNNTGKSTLWLADPPSRQADGGGFYELWLALLDLGLEIRL